MTLWEVIFLFCQYCILVYFALINLSYILNNYLGFRAVRLYNRSLSQFALKSLLERQSYKPISIIVPAYNEEKSIVANVRSLLSLHHPLFEVIVVSDGSLDRTMEVLAEAYGLIEVPFYTYHSTILCKPVLGIYRSLRYPALTVIMKENGGKADAQNAGLNVARHPLVCVVDADSVLDVDALLRCSFLFAEDETVVAVGGTIRALNGAVIRHGQIVELRMPRSWIERF